MTNCNIEYLAKQYNLVGDPIDLSVFYESNGESIIFELLKTLYRSEYESQQRILIIQPSVDYYSYENNLASDALIFLQKCLQKLDISNFFIIVVTGNQNIETELKWLQINHSTDLCAIGYHLTDTEFTKQTKFSDTFCINMWNHLYVNTQLEILPCCFADQDRPLGKLSDNSVNEIINSDSAKSIRVNMLSGKRCIECTKCYTQEDAGISSRRNCDNEKFKKVIEKLKKQTNVDGSLKLFEPQTIDIRLNNICNLKCRTCSGSFSSQLAVEEKNLFGNTINFKNTPTNNLRDRILQSIIHYFDSAEHVYFAGGEPLILKEHYEILDYLIKINKTSIPIFYATNFTKLQYKDKNVLDYWKQFSDVTVNASLDGHGQVFEYVRHGANWNEIENNLNTLKKECPHIKFGVSSTISLISIESVIDLQRMWHQSGMLDINQFQIKLMAGSDYLSLQSLLPSYKNDVSVKIDNHCNWLISVGATDLENTWRKFQKYMWSDKKDYVNEEFAKVNLARDLARNEKFEIIFPQFADLFKPHYKNETKIH